MTNFKDATSLAVKNVHFQNFLQFSKNVNIVIS